MSLEGPDLMSPAKAVFGPGGESVPAVICRAHYLVYSKQRS